MDCIILLSVKPTKEQINLKRLIEDKFNDELCSDYNLIENLENIAGADVCITMGKYKGQDVVYLDVRKKHCNSDPLTKAEEYFYNPIYNNAQETLIAKASSTEKNIEKINNFYKNCQNFVRKILASGEDVK